MGIRGVPGWSPYAARSCQDSCPQKSTHCAPKISCPYLVSANCTQEHKVCTLHTTKYRLHTNCTQSRRCLAPKSTKCTVEGQLHPLLPKVLHTCVIHTAHFTLHICHPQAAKQRQTFYKVKSIAQAVKTRVQN